MADFDYDLFVIGGGSGGVRAGRVAAQLGFKVGVAEEYRFGGTCVIRGCVPKKLMVYASQFSEMFEDAEGFGWTVGERSFDWATLIANKDREIARLEGLYRKGLDTNGADTFASRAEVVGPHEVRIVAEDRVVSAAHILIATGGHPYVPEIEGHEHAIVSDDIFDLPEQPKRAVIIGGGYIACEFAGILNGLGTDVVLSYRSDLFLRGFDHDVREHVAEEMRARGIELLFHTTPERIVKEADGSLRVDLDTGQQLRGDVVMMATGRMPSTAGLGLEQVGVKMRKNGAVEVDAYSQSSIPSIYAVGDVTSRMELTPVAIREGMAFVETVFKGNHTKPDHEMVATAIFTQPEIGTVGLSEDVAHIDHDIEVYVAKFRPMMATLSGREEKMLTKLIVDKKTRRVLGCHIVGHAAGEMIQMAGIAMKMGATKEDFDRTVAVHPTAAEELVTMREPTR